MFTMGVFVWINDCRKNRFVIWWLNIRVIMTVHGIITKHEINWWIPMLVIIIIIIFWIFEMIIPKEIFELNGIYTHTSMAKWKIIEMNIVMEEESNYFWFQFRTILFCLYGSKLIIPPTHKCIYPTIIKTNSMLMIIIMTLILNYWIKL